MGPLVHWKPILSSVMGQGFVPKKIHQDGYCSRNTHDIIMIIHFKWGYMGILHFHTQLCQKLRFHWQHLIWAKLTLQARGRPASCLMRIGVNGQQRSFLGAVGVLASLDTMQRKIDHLYVYIYRYVYCTYPFTYIYIASNLYN